MDGFLIGHLHKPLEMQKFQCCCGCIKHSRWIYCGLPPQEPPGFLDVALQGWSVPSAAHSKDFSFVLEPFVLFPEFLSGEADGRRKTLPSFLSLGALWQPKEKIVFSKSFCI